jgi:hypothetical protein
MIHSNALVSWESKSKRREVHAEQGAADREARTRAVLKGLQDGLL